jgi:hypothetical protein
VAHTKIRRRGSLPAGPPATAGIATDSAYRRNWIGTKGRLRVRGNPNRTPPFLFDSAAWAGWANKAPAGR